MSWTNGTWADVAIGDTVLGGDGYPWEVTEKLVAVWNMESEPVKFYVTIERDGRAATRGELSTSKPVKYRKAEPAPTYSALLELAAPEMAALDASNPLKRIAAGQDPREQVFAELQAARAETKDAKRETALAELVTPAAPYVEYDDAERAAASALKGAGLTMTVIERVMTLDALMEHLEQIHGEPMADFLKSGTLTRIEYRSRLADLHFELHAHDQERGQKWQPRGRTPHVHPVMDRPMEDAVPKSLTRRR